MDDNATPPGDRQERRQVGGARLAWFLAVAYALLIVYSSLTPFAGWRPPADDPLAFLTRQWPRFWTKFDLVINFIAYLPLGILLTFALLRHASRDVSLLIASLLGGALSFGMEVGQGFLPARISSNLDLVANFSGAFAGAMIAVRVGGLRYFAAGFESVRARFRPGTVADLGLALLGLWLFSQLNPSLPLLSNIFVPGSSGENAGTSVLGVHFNFLEALAVALTLLSMGLMLSFVVKRPLHAIAGTPVLLIAAALIKLFSGLVLLRPEARFEWLSNEVWIGAGCGFAALLLCFALPERTRRVVFAAILIALIVVSQLFGDLASDSAIARPFSFNWQYRYLLNFTGLARTVSQVWPFLALLWLYLDRSKRRAAPDEIRPAGAGKL